VDFSRDEIAKILQHGPWPPPLEADPGNRVSGKPDAIAFGEKLFFEPRLSGTGSVLCATCHAPFRQFQDARARAFGLQEVERNTPSLIDARFYRWYGWDGAHDSLWAQSIRPLLDEREMRATPAHVARVIRSLFSNDYEKTFGYPPNRGDEETLADAGKALAAFQETLVSARTPFDEFRDALEKHAPTTYPPAAQRGLRIFVGKGNCSVCHSGPQFTNGEFPGGQAAIGKLKKTPFNLLGRYNDDKSGRNALATKRLDTEQRSFGEFRVPGLRGVAQTAPYMHDGSLATLRDALQFHSRLNDDELADLVAFLESLSPPGRPDNR
jgi:cytochrome c peroxidase